MQVRVLGHFKSATCADLTRTCFVAQSDVGISGAIYGLVQQLLDKVEEKPAGPLRPDGALEVEGSMSRLFQIHEQDLADLEQVLPHLADALATPDMTNKQRVQLRRVQKIISDIRWDYGPPGPVKVIPANDDQESL